MNLLSLQSENYKKIITAALMVSIVFSLIPLRPAKALIFSDVIHTIKTFLQSFWDKYLKQVWEQAQNILIESIKQQVLGRLINQTLTWVAGGGKPQFITNWKGFVNDAAKNVRNEMLKQIKNFANTCLPFKAALNILLDLQYKMGPLQELQCPNPLLNNPLFFKNFDIGGWPGYMDSYLPAGNFSGAANIGASIVDGQAAVAAGAAQNEGAAGKGFASAKKCVTTAEGKKCDEIKTPGSTIAGMTDNILDSPKDFIVNSGAKTVGTLAALLIFATLGKMITKGLGP
ncbi:MAG: hypothetical protein HYW34_03535 [Candidatus Brennerbacteria bacterium]|nr:hypothetical protein [Candidatus Brennerbacteria bacterium]